ncbi:MAG: stage III sporulation protein AF [Defluviitaleaceae bacterium]|nr:stage III sporulation protein AF [Defluviitaleaceae bacterium]
MLAFFEYLRNITYYLMFATVAGMVAPSGKYRKFVSLVLGFVLLLLMLRPLVRFGNELEISDWFTGIIPGNEMAQGDWQAAHTDWQNTYLREVFEAQLEAQLTNLLENDGFTVHWAEIDYTDDFSQITGVRVSVSREEQAVRVPFIRIQPVQIGQPESEQDAGDCPTATAAKKLISEFYNLPTAHIHVNVTKAR